MHNSQSWRIVTDVAYTEAQQLFDQINAQYIPEELEDFDTPVNTAALLEGFRASRDLASTAYCLGSVCVARGDFAQARHFRESIEDPNESSTKILLSLDLLDAGDPDALQSIHNILTEEKVFAASQNHHLGYSSFALRKMVVYCAKNSLPAQLWIEGYGVDKQHKLTLLNEYTKALPLATAEDWRKLTTSREIIDADTILEDGSHIPIFAGIIRDSQYSPAQRQLALANFQRMWDAGVPEKYHTFSSVTAVAWDYMREGNDIQSPESSEWLAAALVKELHSDREIEIPSKHRLELAIAILAGATGEQIIEILNAHYFSDQAVYDATNSQHFMLTEPFESRAAHCAEALAGLGNFAAAGVILKAIHQKEEAFLNEQLRSPDIEAEDLTDEDVDAGLFMLDETISEATRLMHYTRNEADLNALDIDDIALMQPIVGFAAARRRFEYSRDPRYRQVALDSLEMVRFHPESRAALYLDHEISELCAKDLGFAREAVATIKANPSIMDNKNYDDVYHFEKHIAEAGDSAALASLLLIARRIENTYRRCVRIANVALIGTRFNASKNMEQ